MATHHLTKVDRYLDDEGEHQITLDAALEMIHREAQAALAALRLVAAAQTHDDRVDYLITAIDAFKGIINAKEQARVASGEMAIARSQIRDLHLIIPNGRHAEAVA